MFHYKRKINMNVDEFDPDNDFAILMVRYVMNSRKYQLDFARFVK